MTATIPARAQMRADRAGRVRLVAAHPVWSGAWPARPSPGDAEVLHQDQEHRRVTHLTSPDHDHQRQAAPANELMDLRAQTPRATGRFRDLRAHFADSCNSTEPPVSRGRLVAC